MLSTLSRALVSVKPLLTSYPELQKKIDSSLAEANLQPNMPDRAHALRKALDEIRNAVNPAATASRKDIAKQPKKGQVKKLPTLWDRLGGEKGVTKVLTDLFEAAAADPKVDFTRGGKYPLTPDNVRRPSEIGPRFCQQCHWRALQVHRAFHARRP